jgi:endoglucanase
MVMVGRMRVITGPGNYNNYRELPHLVIPADDPGIVATFHYYDPFHCTHQGALWIGAEAVRAEVQAAFDGAVAWAKKHGVEMYVGEFGAYEKADRESRIRWMEFIAAECRARGMSSAYWEFCRGFGAFGPVAESWREPLLRALLSKRNPANTE